MLINGLNSRAAGTVGEVANQDQLARLEEQLRRLEADKQALANTKDYFELLPMEDQARVREIEAEIEALSHLLETYRDFVTTGKWDPAAVNQIDVDAVEEHLAGLEPGWNDMSGAIENVIAAEDKKKVGSTYVGTIMLDNSGVYDPQNPLASNALAFVVPAGATAVAGQTVGKDIHIKVTFADKHVETTVLKNMAVRPEAIYMYGATHAGPLALDFSNVIRVSDGNWGKPFGETSGLFIFAGAGHDRVLGSQGDDVIVGNGGNDALYGNGGKDLIFGDGFNEDGAAGFEPTDGNDLIDGGAEADTIRAGGGNQDQILNIADDSAGEHENAGATEKLEQVDVKLIIPDQNVPAKYQNGSLVVDGYALTGPFNVQMPKGYSMATAEVDENGKSLVITMVGFDQQGAPHTLRVMVKGFFDPANHIQLNFHGNDVGNNMIDFHNITLKGNTININAGDGDDIIMAPRTYLDDLGIPVSELGTSTLSESELEDIVDVMRSVHTDDDGKTQTHPLTWGLDAYPETDGFAWNDFEIEDNGSFVQNGEVVLVGNGNPVESLNFERPEGFDDAVLMRDGDDFKLVFFKRGVDTVDQVVVRLKGISADTTVFVAGAPIPTIGGLSEVVGGNGDDTIYASVNSVATGNQSNESVVTGAYPFAWAEPVQPGTPLTEQLTEVEKEIDDLNEELGEKQAAFDKETDEKKKTKLQQQIDALQDQVDELETQKKKLEAKQGKK
ncbi:MAG: hypothetical protein HY696_03860 [Deltaproteobacteria bacterium]|nr:hypothetical protein [Deltaproteobacteria bacterium]